MNEAVSGDAARVAPAEAAPDGSRLRIPAVAASIALLLAAVPLFWPAFVELAARWEEPGGGNSHGWIVVALVPVLAWLRRDRVSFAQRGRLRALVLALVLGAAYAAARAAHVELAAWSVLPPLVFAALVACHGWRGARPLAAATAYLYFALPVWGLLTPALQAATVVASSALLRAIGLSVYIDGDFVTVPAGTFEIAGGCAGTSFFVVALATATLFAYVERMRPRDALRLCAVAAAMAIVLNWLRVAVIIVVGNATAMQTSLVDDHYALGWWMFAAGLLPLFLYARRLAARTPPAVGQAVRRVAATRAVATAVPALAVLAAGPAWAAFVVDRVGPVPVLAAPEVTGWTRGEAETRWTPTFPGAAAYLRATYRRGEATVDVFAAFYGRQRPMEKLVGYPSSVAGEPWSPAGSRSLSRVQGAPILVEELVGPGGRRRVVWSWYEVRGERLGSALAVKSREALGVFGERARSGVVALSTECAPECERAHEILASAYEAGLARLSAGTAVR